MKKLLITFLCLVMLLCTAFAVACGGGNEGEDSGNDQNQNVPEVPSHPDFVFVLTEDGNSYAITGHKAQGSQWEKVLVFEENFPFDKMEHARWLYTAATRASDKLVLVR
jgi:hypothetical protein